MAQNLRIFISYASVVRDWVAVLARNLEQAGFTVFFDQGAILPGQPWWTRLQQGVSQADKLVLVVTPEAMASPWVGQEVASFSAQCAEKVRAGALVPVLLAHAPLPPFVEGSQFVDLRGHDAGRYGEAFRRMVASLKGFPDTRLVEPPVQIPPSPRCALPGALRERVWEWLAPALGSKVARKALSGDLWKKDALEGFPTPELAASAAILLATGDDDPVRGAIRLVEQVVAAEILDADGAAPLLDALRACAPKKGGLLAVWLERVAADHANLTPFFKKGRLDLLLDKVYVRLDLRPELARRMVDRGGMDCEGGKRPS